MNNDKKQLLIILGPQGSGNHIFARAFSMHPEVTGWEELKEKYWVKHCRESFAEYWWYPQLMTSEIFNNSQYHVASVSFPYVYDGYIIKPKILEVANLAKSWGIDVKIAVITRDETINKMQQHRIRKKITVDEAKEYIINELIPSEFPVHFLSLETFFSYKTNYLKYLEKILDFPIGHNDPNILKFIDESPNFKYITPIDRHWLDEECVEGFDFDTTYRQGKND
jgi:hypothetical protein